MPRPSSDYRAIHAAADALEPKLARVVVIAAQRLQQTVNLNMLAGALASRRVDMVLALLPTKTQIAAALEPAKTIVAEGVARGGRIGAKQVNSLS